MARGRMISKSLSTSMKFAKLGNEFAQVLYMLVVSHADDFGRQSGDAFTVKHQVLPTSARDESQFEVALTQMEEVGLIERYDSGGEKVLQVVSFEQHQVGLHKRSASRFPENPGTSGKFPEIPSELKRREEKGTELNGTEENGTDPPRPRPRPLTAKRNLHAEFECDRFDVPTSWHLRTAKGLSNGETRLMVFYRWLVERVARTNEDTLPRFAWLDRCFTEWLDSTKVAASSVPSSEDTRRMMANMEAERDPRFEGLTNQQKIALAKSLKEAGTV